MHIRTTWIRKYGRFFFGLFFSGVLAACGGGGGGGGAPALETPIGDVSGTWTITDTASSSNPSCDGEVKTRFLTIAQSNNSLTATDPFGGQFTGTISGATISWSGDFQEDGGTTTVQSLTATIAADCNSVQGNSTWSFTDGVLSCSGTSTFTGTRDNPVGCGAGGGVAEQEPNNDSNTAQAITLPATISGSIVNTDSADVFSFTVSATQTVTATLNGAGGDMDLAFFETNETLLALSNSPTSNETLTRSFTPGTYLVVVFPFNVPTATSYTLSVQ